MAIYRFARDKKILEEFRETTFVRERIKEDPDLRYMLRNQPEIIEDELFILAEEFSGKWQGSGRSIDLLGLDQNGRLTVIELKRTSTGDYAELQAIRYAAMIRVLDSDDIVDAHRSYMTKWSIEGEAEERIRRHLDNTDIEEIDTDTPRIVLVSAGFSRELTTSVLWLNEKGIEITCIQIRPHLNGEELLIESSQVIPVPGTEELLVRVQEKKNTARYQRSSSKNQSQGGEVFRESILQSSENIRPALQEFYRWASSLEQDDLATLTTEVKANTSLQIRGPDYKALITVQNKIKNNTATVLLYANNLRVNSPKTTSLLDSSLGTDIGITKNSTVNRVLTSLPSNSWDIFRQAYREANGLPLGEDDQEN